MKSRMVLACLSAVSASFWLFISQKFLVMLTNLHR